MEIVELIQAEDSGVFVLPEKYKDYKILDVLVDGNLFPHDKWQMLSSNDGIILNCRFKQGAKFEAHVRKD